ncbi:type II secretion system protein [Chloroflexota bacterium]
MGNTSLLYNEKETRRVRSSSSGFTLFESIIVIAVFVAFAFAIYYFGWGTKDKAGEQRLEQDTSTIQNAIAEYLIDSYLSTGKGLYPTDDGKLPGGGEYKLILWTASYNAPSKTVYFKDYFGSGRLPRHWDEGVWRIDSMGQVTVDIEY